MKHKQARRYQLASVAAVQSRWVVDGARAVCLVMPPGAGKTFVGSGIALAHDRVRWVCHRRELVDQAVAELRGMLGDSSAVGVEMAGRRESVGARVIVTTVQSMIEREVEANEDLLVLDECHHFAADVWGQVPAEHKAKRILGLTATPERADGRPLDHIFQALVSEATYAELIETGVLVPWTIFGPPKHLGHDWAMDPIEAYRALADGKKAFGYYLRVDVANEYADRFSQAGVEARCVSYESPRGERDAALAGFRGLADEVPLKMLTNVYALTEGVNVPEASVVMLARPFAFLGGYIQACGRGGRATAGKTHATLIDLCGSARAHGDPFQEYDYSLSGKPITRREVDEENEEERPPRDYVEPKLAGTGISLLGSSTFQPDLSRLPPEFLPRNNSKRLGELERRARRRGGSSVASFARRHGGGLGE